MGGYVGISNLARKIKGIYVGVGGLAKRVLKGYVGINGTAHLCYLLNRVEKLTSVTSLSVARAQLAAITHAGYALFAGGASPVQSGSGSKTTVETYNGSLVRGSATALATGRYALGSAKTGNYALFAGGSNYSSMQNRVDAYDTNLTHTTPTSLNSSMATGGASIGDYAIFCGNTSYANAYNSSLVRNTNTSISTPAGKYNLSATLGEYAFFAGGYGNSATKGVDAINASLVRTSPTSLTLNNSGGAVASNKNYAVVFSNYGANVDAYSTSLVKSILTNAPETLNSRTPVSTENVAFFAGGQSSTGTMFFGYDANLVKTYYEPISHARGASGGTVIDGIILFAGGNTNNGSSSFNYVDGYKINY